MAIVRTELQTSAEMLLMYLPGTVWPPWLQLKCILSILQPYIYPAQDLGCVHLMMCLGYGAHRAHRTTIVLQMHPPVEVGPPWLQLEGNLRVPQI